MKILMLLNAYYPDDIRVRKEASSLVAAGHTVYLLCRRNSNESYSGTHDSVNVIRINAGTNNYMLAFWDIWMSLVFKHPIFLKRGIQLVDQFEIDALHIHDLPLAGTALQIRKMRPSVKVIVDLHENYPEGLKVWHQWKKNPIARLKNKIFMDYPRWQKHEKSAVQNADHIVAVVDEMKEKLIKNHKITESKITVVSNTEDKSFLLQPDNPDIYQLPKDTFIIAYCGGIGPHRGVDIMIKGMKLLRSKKDIKMVISGFGSPSIMNYLRSLISELELEDVVEMRGKVPFLEFYSLMKYSNVNVIPHSSNGHTDHTIPHKLFQGMMTGTPLLVSTCSPLKRVVTEFKCGLVFEAGNEIDFSNKIIELYGSEEIRKELGSNGMQASVEGTQNWESTANDLLGVYEDLL